MWHLVDAKVRMIRPIVATGAPISSKIFTRAARTRNKSSSHSAIIWACSRCAGPVSEPQIACARRLVSAGVPGTFRIVAARPCRRALRLMRFFASAVRGPVLRCEFCWLAAILRSDGMAQRCWGLHALLCSNARDLRAHYFIGRGAQTLTHVIASELNFAQNSVSAELRRCEELFYAFIFLDMFE